MGPRDDWCSLPGNQELARRIRAYWSNRNRDVEVVVVTAARADGDPIYGVRSNLVNGAPKQ